MICNDSALSWSEFPSDLVSQIFVRLEIVDFIQFAAVCRPWNQARISNNCRPKPSTLPWLMFSSPDDPDSRYFYSLTEQRMRKIHLPMISGRHLIGSSAGFLVSISHQALVCITSPLTGAHYALPSTLTLPNLGDQVDIDHVVRDPSSGLITNFLSWQEDENGGRELEDVTDFMCKYIFSKAVVAQGGEGKPTVFVTYGPHQDIAFARPGDTSWKNLNTDRDIFFFFDIIFHKGRLHAVNFKGTIVVYDDFKLSCDPSFISPDGPLQDLNGNDRRYLVESPDGKDLYLIGREMHDLGLGDPKPFNRTLRFMVFLLNKSSYTWTPVTDVGDTAFFLGFNRSMALSVKEFPELKRNCVYFTDDLKLIYIDEPESAGDMGICDLGDGSMHPMLPSTVDYERLNWPPALWFTPAFP